MTHSRVDQALKIAIGGLLAALGFLIAYTMQEHIVDVGDHAPNFTIITDRGQRISPRDFGGKVLVLNFWAAWCPPCIQEAPSLNEFAKMVAPSGVVVLGISVDQNQKQYESFLKKFQIAFPTARDPEQNTTYRYGTYKFPESYIIDRNGKVVRKFPGLPESNGHTIPWTDPELVGYVKSLAS
ncbi:MAG TPA: TlpA disulfide reductase family protein [Bryobacteraceae bacterium]|nr:TlpA disulfide reductase family protein [Bryobacteraceae bacterium]